MGIVASRHLNAETEHQIQQETGFSPHRIDYLLGQYQTLERDTEGVVLRSELLKVPPVANHPLSDRLVDVYLHPSRDFCHFMQGLSRFRHNVPLEQKLASIISMYDTDGDGLLSIEQCEKLIRRLPATRRELRTMLWKLKMLLITENLQQEQHDTPQLRAEQLIQREIRIEQESQEGKETQISKAQQLQSWNSQDLSMRELQKKEQKLPREQLNSKDQLRNFNHEEQLFLFKLQKQKRSGYSQELDKKLQQERQDNNQLREDQGDQRRDSQLKFQEALQMPQYEVLDAESSHNEVVKMLLENRQKTLEQSKGRKQLQQQDLKTLLVRQQQDLKKQHEEHQQIRNLKELRKEQKLSEQQPQDSKGRINCEDFAYITRGIDLEQSLSLRFN